MELKLPYTWTMYRTDWTNPQPMFLVDGVVALQQAVQRRKQFASGIQEVFMNEKESKIQAKCMKIVRNYGGYIYKNAQSVYTEVGRPDCTACIPVTIKRLVELFGENATIGLFVGMEFKVNEKKYSTTKAQKIVGQQIKEAKGLWFAIDDPDIVEGLMIKLTGGKNEL